MNNEDQIHCPKCNSTQVTANKKGFSGKKAVAGAILTGGIGILAGTIGSNKILITCLNCGNQFKPGDKPRFTNQPALIWDEQSKKHIPNPNRSSDTTIMPFKVVAWVVGVLFVLLIGTCLFSGNKTETLEQVVKESTPAPITVKPTPKPNIEYEIVNEQNGTDGSANMVFVYLKDKKGIDSLNTYLINQYPNKNAYGFQILYFNNRKIAKNYHNAVFDKNLSESQIEKMETHIIARYEYNSTDGGKLEFGKEARE
jgi:hypothetical protein